ncbi:tRNA uridine-5-carboxymethylaminomethyl(34) synthesis GTPase MnmE [Thiolapillus brandeum]|uniref:tRNA modification GTPase MnmE n=1 Tax=Thiolapillus brandeum TaxID=1076588 RepID=A0A7U6JLK5_9GAMM|nr:tRNA uridine-5-carboxymethylaminomethyl(34) synthesis GTPase MnmE [Thiolapillus brandeum]BAO45760.1 tRNA modification GTPase TrmE [Thiolapillus brandeum]
MSTHSHDTIAAIATPAGRGGVGIVRISGRNALDIGREITRLSPIPRHAHYGDFLDASGQVIDQGILLYFKAPHSFTGEDVIELQGHGGPVVMDMLLDRCLKLGARLAHPGEFSERAYLNDRMDLTQAEAVADLIDAETSTAARLATRSLQGSFSTAINELLESLVHLRMYVEAAIDFPEEEIDFLSDGKVSTDLHAVIDNISKVRAKARTGRILRDGINLVIAGEPNAGKSSLLNALAGVDSAIVTEIPGTTRDLLREHIQLGGVPIHLVDTAGLRDTEDQVEREGVRRAREALQGADRLLWVYDAATDPRNQGLEQARLPQGIPVTLVRNKVDKIGETPGQGQQQGRDEIRLSARTGDGIGLLKEHLLASMGFQGAENTEYLARRRHLDAIDRALAALENGRIALERHQAGELLAEDLRQAQQALSEITGDFSADDLLGEIFSSFCIGK